MNNPAALHVFRHHAMATYFEIRICGEDPIYSAQAAQEAFATVDRLEQRLSRFRSDSEISHLRGLQPRESLRLNIDTFCCLEKAVQLRQLTRGAFDPQFAERTGRFSLDRATLTVRCERAPILLDLGAIGKGFALDGMAEVLREWEIERALLVSGRSTILALEPPEGRTGWEVILLGTHRLSLGHAALSCSGTSVKGTHIMDPFTGQPARGAHRAWALADSAASSDALSTAWMILGPTEVQKICDATRGIGAILQTRSERPRELFTAGVEGQFALTAIPPAANA